jgi:TolB-like protein/Tfp pilus assembly protein PilF
MSFIAELKRRNVIRTAIAYLALAWLSIEVSDTVLPMFGFSPQIPRIIVLVSVIGFVPVMLFAWAFEFTAEGLKLDKNVDRAAPQVVAAGKRLDRVVIALLGLALAWFAFDKFILSPERESTVVEAARQQATTEALEQATAQAFDQSIAILPFANASGDSGNDYLSNGISDELRDRLAQVQGLRVTARSSSIRFHGQDLDAPAIAGQLGVSRMIEGRFNRQGNRVLLSVQLVDAESGFQLWSQSYERASRDLLLLQQELAQAVVSQLMPELLPVEAALNPSPQQVSAHDLLLLGRQYEQQVTDQQVVDEAKLQKAIEYYRQAIEEDPQSAEAHARLGKMLLYLGDVDAAEGPIFKALELNPRLSDAQATLGLYYWLTRQPGIGAAYLRAIELNPNNADALSYYASWLWMQGETDQSTNYYRLARNVDPLSLVRHAELGNKLAFEGSREEAQSVVARILELFPTAPGYLAAARITEAYGVPDEAIGYALKARLLRPDDPDIAGQLAEMHARIGDFESAALFEPEPGMGQLFWQRRYAELIDLGEELAIDQPGDADVLFLLAFAYNAAGRFADSLRILELAGMPEAALSESRRATELHTMLTVVGALAGNGDTERAYALAASDLKRHQKFSSGNEKNAPALRLGMACELAVLGEDEEALNWLESLKTLPNIVGLPLLKDHACFQKFVDEPRYQAVVSANEERLAAIRERLPQTLERQGLLPGSPDQK